MKVGAKSKVFHREDVLVLDLLHWGDKLLVPAGIDDVHRFLDQYIWLAEPHMQDDQEAD
jgi:hypothetical protein